MHRLRWVGFWGTKEDENLLQTQAEVLHPWALLYSFWPTGHCWPWFLSAFLSCSLLQPFLSAAGGLCCVWQWRAGRCCIQCNWMMWHRFPGSCCQQSCFGPHCSSPSSQQQIKAGAETSDHHQQLDSKQDGCSTPFYHGAEKDSRRLPFSISNVVKLVIVHVDPFLSKSTALWTFAQRFRKHHIGVQSLFMLPENSELKVNAEIVLVIGILLPVQGFPKPFSSWPQNSSDREQLCEHTNRPIKHRQKRTHHFWLVMNWAGL